MPSPDRNAMLEKCRLMLREIVKDQGLDRVEIQVLARTLTPEQAIGTPGRGDFPIIEGKERVIEATVLGARGQAFTDSPSDFQGRIGEILELPFTDNRRRAIFVASLNAVLRYLDLVQGTIHCQDDDPEICSREIAAAAKKSGARSVGLIGLNPAIAQALVREFGTEPVRIADLNRENIGRKKFGVEILDGRDRARELIDESDFLLITGTTIVNETFEELWGLVKRYGKPALLYGMTAAGVSLLMNLPRLCPCARS